MSEYIEELFANILCSSHMSIESTTTMLFEHETFNNYINSVAKKYLFDGAFSNLNMEIIEKANEQYRLDSNLQSQLEGEVSAALDGNNINADIIKESLKEENGIIYFKIIFKF